MGGRRYAFNLLLFYETQNAYLVGREPMDRETDACFWLPKSECSCDQTISKNGITTGVFSVNERMCELKGLDPGTEAIGSDDEDDGLDDLIEDDE